MGRRIAPPRQSSAFATVDFDRAGKQVGFIMIPHSPHEDAWGVTRIPVAVIQNGVGPTVIVEGGNHGDEYEGPIVISELVRELDPASIQGRLILLPAINVHAAMAGRRTSPVDGLNFNRTFPGDPRGSITEQISAFVADEIFPRADAFLDLHSGGSSLDLITSAVIEPTDDAELHRKNVAAALAFDAPATVVIGNLGDPRTSTAAACRAGLVTVGTEMGGGGTVSPEALAICRQGVRNVLAHLGVLPQGQGRPAERRETGDRVARTEGLRLRDDRRNFRAFSRKGAGGQGRRARRPYPCSLGSRAPAGAAGLRGRRHPLRPSPAGPREARKLLPRRCSALQGRPGLSPPRLRPQDALPFGLAPFPGTA